MTTCRDVISRALQQAGIVSLGREPKVKEAEAGLLALQGIYDGWIQGGMFGRLTDVRATADYTAKEGERVFADGATVTLPDEIEDGGTTRSPRDLACISINDGTWRTWVWTGAWTELTGLALGDDAPLAERDAEGLASLLATYLAEGFGTSVGPMTMRRATQYQGGISYKLGSTQDVKASEYF